MINPLQDDIEQNISRIRFRNGTPKSIQGSTFQGHLSDVTSVEDIAPSLQIMFMDTRVARATHNTYAYRVLTEGKFTEHALCGRRGVGCRKAHFEDTPKQKHHEQISRPIQMVWWTKFGTQKI